MFINTDDIIYVLIVRKLILKYLYILGTLKKINEKYNIYVDSFSIKIIPIIDIYNDHITVQDIDTKYLI